MCYPEHETLAQALLCNVCRCGGSTYHCHARDAYEPLADVLRLTRAERVAPRSDGYPGRCWDNLVQGTRQRLINEGYAESRGRGHLGFDAKGSVTYGVDLPAMTEGDETMATLAEQFAARLWNSIEKTRELGYNPQRFANLLETTDAVHLAHQYVATSELHDGFVQVIGLGHPELTMESIMLEPQFSALFSAPVRAAAQWRLSQAKAV